MRIASLYAFEATIDNLQKRQQGLSRSQDQLSSGLRVQRASDDPAAAARAERSRAISARAEAEERALNLSRQSMQISESALGDAGELMQQARELLLSAGNGTRGDDGLRIIGEAIRNLRTDLFATANRSDGTGRYVFGGLGSDQPPFADAPGGVIYRGTLGAQQVTPDERLPLSIDGYAVWLGTPDPGNPTATISPFSALEKIASELMTPGRTPAEVAQTISTGLAELDATAATLSAERSRTGAALNRIDNAAARLADTRLDAEAHRSNAEDLDLVEAISDFQQRQSGYDAALKSYSIVQRLSLFDYLR
jgi:flagellar hook-associated protein 3 FlgL